MRLIRLFLLTPILAVLSIGGPTAMIQAEEFTLKGCLEKALAGNPQIAEAELGRQGWTKLHEDHRYGRDISK